MRNYGCRILDDSDHQAGDPQPEGYLAWHAWADTQDKAGLRQRRCSNCCKFKYPQELGKPSTSTAITLVGFLDVVDEICIECEVKLQCGRGRR